jgi:hypothetical protein
MRLLTVASAAIVAALGVAATPAAAVVVAFASFDPLGLSANFRWVESSNTVAGHFGRSADFYTTSTANGTSPGMRSVYFSFLQPELAPYATYLTAKFLLNGTVTNTIATVADQTLTQTNLTGTFYFLSTSDITIFNHFFPTGSTLLSGTFSQGYLSGLRNGTSAGISASTPTSTITYTSDFLAFIPNSQFDLAGSLVSIIPAFNALAADNGVTGAPNKAVRSFRAVLGGVFSSDPAPNVTAVPEPDAWGFMVMGFGMIGVRVRRRKISVPV